MPSPSLLSPAVEPYPEQAIDHAQPWTTRTLALENAQVMAQGYDFQFQLCPAAEPANEHRRSRVYVREHGRHYGGQCQTLAFPTLSKF
jgi:hypothetical protein